MQISNIFSSFSPQIFFDNFSREIKVVNSSKVPNRSIFTSFHPKQFDNFSREIKVEFLDKKWRFRTVCSIRYWQFFECYGHAISCKGKLFTPWPFPILFSFRFLHEITTIIKLYWTLFFFSCWTQFIFRIFAIFYCLCIFGFLKIRLQTTRVSSYFRIFVHFVYQLFGQTLVTRRWSKEDKCKCCIILKDCIKSEKNKSWPDCHSTQFYWSTENQRSLNKIIRV